VEAELSLRFDDEVLSFADPDGLAVELIASTADDRAPWGGGPVPPEHGIRGFRAITVTVVSADATAALLTGPMGFETVASKGSRSRFVSARGAVAGIIDVLEAPRQPEGIVSAGTVHHVAWRTPGDEEQLVWRAALIAAGRDVTHVYDRRYFHSIYYREPGGVLFEIATDPPGFTLDEPAAELGARLALPPWLEESRPRIEAHLPPITLPVTPAPAG
jgi:glyoxalase family protein